MGEAVPVQRPDATFLVGALPAIWLCTGQRSRRHNARTPERYLWLTHISTIKKIFLQDFCRSQKKV